jgi:hypothetical protein
MARSLETRIARLEAEAGRASDYTTAVQAAWDVEAAKTRVAARVRLKIGEACEAGGHPAVIWARTFLVGDTPAQAEADLATLQHWAASHPDAFDPDEDGRTRIMQKLEEMAQRWQAHKGVI